MPGMLEEEQEGQNDELSEQNYWILYKNALGTFKQRCDLIFTGLLHLNQTCQTRGLQ